MVAEYHVKFVYKYSEILCVVFCMHFALAVPLGGKPVDPTPGRTEGILLSLAGHFRLS